MAVPVGCAHRLMRCRPHHGPPSRRLKLKIALDDLDSPNLVGLGGVGVGSDVVSRRRHQHHEAVAWNRLASSSNQSWCRASLKDRPTHRAPPAQARTTVRLLVASLLALRQNNDVGSLIGAFQNSYQVGRRRGRSVKARRQVSAAHRPPPAPPTTTIRSSSSSSTSRRIVIIIIAIKRSISTTNRDRQRRSTGINRNRIAYTEDQSIITGGPGSSIT